MAGRNYIPLSDLRLRSDHRRLDDSADLRRRRLLSPIEFRLIEERIAAQSRQIETLLVDNQRLAATHVALKQDVIAAQQDLHRLSATASSVKAERDAHVREVHERSLKLELDAHSIDSISAELNRVQAEIKELQTDRDKLADKLKKIQDDIARNHPEQQEFSQLKTDIDALHREIRKGRAAVEYERKMKSTNLELSEIMEKHMVTLAREAENLRSELANAEKRAMAAVVGTGTTANPGGYAIQQTTREPGYAIHQRTHELGFGVNSLSGHPAVHQGTFDGSLNYVYGGEPNIPYGQYNNIQR